MKARFIFLTTVALRMVLSVLMLAIVVSGLPAEDFGLFATAFGIGTLCGVLSNLGFPIALVRDGAENRAAIRPLTVAALTCKAVILLLGAVFGGAIVSVSHSSLAAGPLVVLIGALVMASFGDLLFLVQRSLGNAKNELAVVAAIFVIQLALLGIVRSHGGTVSHYIYAIVAPRILYSAAAFWLFDRSFPMAADAVRVAPVGYLRKNVNLAVEGAIINASTQIDGLLVAHTMGFASAGMYQAATRIVYGVLPLGSALNSLVLPKISRASASAQRERIQKELIGCVAEFSAMGAACAILVYGLGPIYARTLLDPSYGAVMELWPLLSLLIFIKLCTSGFGVFLAVVHTGRLRLYTQVLAFALTVALIAQSDDTTPLRNIVQINLAVACVHLSCFLLITRRELRRFNSRSTDADSPVPTGSRPCVR